MDSYNCGHAVKKDNPCRVRICVFNEPFSKTICLRMFEDMCVQIVHARGHCKAHVVCGHEEEFPRCQREREREASPAFPPPSLASLDNRSRPILGLS